MAESWVPNTAASSDFSLANIPFGIISTSADPSPHVGVAIGAHVLDLKALALHPDFSSLFPDVDGPAVFSQPSLNAFAALGRPIHRKVRETIQEILSVNTANPAFLRDNEELRSQTLLPRQAVRVHLPMQIGDYTDFYAGYNHAYNIGALFRGPQAALQPNYTHLPVGYHGRSSSIVPSGTAIRRPTGQILLDPTADLKEPVTGPSRWLDFELELGCFIARPTQMGEPVSIDKAEDYIFGYVLLNDWSARDIQAWEYVPLGPFNSKNFATTISPWVVLADALESFRAPGIENPTPLQPYLQEKREDKVFDIQMEVDLTSTSHHGLSQSSRGLCFPADDMLMPCDREQRQKETPQQSAEQAPRT